MSSIRYLGFGAALAATFAVRSLRADTFYVAPAPAGDDGNSGAEDAPFATADRAQDAAAAGDTVYFRGGTYAFSGSSDIGVLFDKSGSSGMPINYWAYPGETPVFDFFDLTPQARIRGFSVRASWLHFRGLELTGVQQILVNENESWCIRVENGASNNVFEQLNLHHNEGPGLFIADGGNNLVLNVDSHHNYDPDQNGENSDGFGCHTNDTGNVFRGCRAWYNSDDGFDFINCPAVCTVEYSWAFRNGYQPDSTTVSGNGAGIKGGGFTNNVPATIPRHVIRGNVSWANRRQGFYANHHEGGLDWINNTAFDNGERNFHMLADEGPAPHVLRNNLAYGDGGDLEEANLDEITQSSNSWQGGVSVSDADFMSVSDADVTGPRQADGSLPNVAFLKLADGSDLIDAGEDVGLPFNGEAPDMGANESGGPLPPATGGSPAGGAAGNGGGGSAGAPGGGVTNAGGSPAGGATTSGAAGTSPTAGGATATGGAATTGGGIGTGGAGGAVGTTGGSASTTGGSGTAGVPTSQSGGTTGAAQGGATTGMGGTLGGGATNPGGTTTLGGPAEGEGCGCRVAGAPGRPWSALLAAGLALAAFARRRKSSGPPYLRARAKGCARS